MKTRNRNITITKILLVTMLFAMLTAFSGLSVFAATDGTDGAKTTAFPTVSAVDVLASSVTNAITAAPDTSKEGPGKKIVEAFLAPTATVAGKLWYTTKVTTTKANEVTFTLTADGGSTAVKSGSKTDAKGATKGTKAEGENNGVNGTDGVLGVAAYTVGNEAADDVISIAVTKSVKTAPDPEITVEAASGIFTVKFPAGDDAVDFAATYTFTPVIGAGIVYTNADTDPAKTQAMFKAGKPIKLDVVCWDSARILKPEGSSWAATDMKIDMALEGIVGKVFNEDTTYMLSTDGGAKWKAVKLTNFGTDESPNLGIDLAKVFGKSKVTLAVAVKPAKGNPSAEYGVKPGFANDTAYTATKEGIVEARPTLSKDLIVAYAGTGAAPTWGFSTDKSKGTLYAKTDLEWGYAPLVKTAKTKYVAYTSAQQIAYDLFKGDANDEQLVGGATKDDATYANKYDPDVPKLKAPKINARIAATIAADKVVPASTAKSYAPKKQAAAPKVAIDYKKEMIKPKAGFIIAGAADFNQVDKATVLTVPGTALAKENALVKSGIGVSNYISDPSKAFTVYVGAVATKSPATAVATVYSKVGGAADGEAIARATAPTPGDFSFDEKGKNTTSTLKQMEAWDSAKGKWGAFPKIDKAKTVLVRYKNAASVKNGGTAASTSASIKFTYAQTKDDKGKVNGATITAVSP